LIANQDYPPVSEARSVDPSSKNRRKLTPLCLQVSEMLNITSDSPNWTAPLSFMIAELTVDVA
jgi:hypothetical protein